MPKVILFAIMWGFFWETIIFDFTGFYLFSAFASAVFLSYSPLIIKAVNILIAGMILFIVIFLWIFMISSFQMPSANLLFHILFYMAISLAFIFSIYVFEKKS